MLLLSLASVAALAADRMSASVPQETVEAVLQALEDTGVDVLYSSDLVPPGLPAPPASEGRSKSSSTPLQRAIDVLASHGLALRAIGPNRYVITRAAVPVQATPQPSPVEEQPLTAVSVYASRYAIAGRGIGEPRLVTSTDVEMVPGSQDDPLRALRALPGLASSVSARPYIRGSLSEDVLIRFDGVTLLDPFHLKSFQSLISAIDPAAVEHMEVYSGGFPVQYGTRSGGVIDITPRSRSTGYENSVSLSLLTAGGSSVGSSERWPLEWLVTARRSIIDLVLEPLNADIGRPEFADTLGRIRWSPSERTDWSLGWLLLDDSISLQAEQETARASYRDEYLWLRHEYRWNERLSVRTVLASTTAERTRAGTLDRPWLGTGEIADERKIERRQLDSDWTWQIDDALSASFGASIATSRAPYSYSRSSQFELVAAQAFGRDEVEEESSSARPEAFSYAAHLSARRRWTRFEAEAGLRFDAEDYRPGGRFTNLSPRLNLRFDLSERWRAYASLGEFTQAQRVDEWRTEEAQLTPDPTQVAVHTVVGITRGDPGGVRWSLEGYRKRWTTTSSYFDNLLNPLGLLPDSTPDRVRLTPGASEASGVEFNLHAPLAERLAGWTSVTAASVNDEIDGREVSRSWDQPWAVNAGLTWTGSRASIALLGGWHSGWPRTPVRAVTSAVGSSGALVLGERNSARWADFLTVDLRASWRHPTTVGELSTFIELTNISNLQNECCLDLDQPDEPGQLPLLETSHSLPLVANLGFTFHWGSD
ncbi:MAG: TonB-dependent receptor [Proteobacteria bacterium]|nr:TonB-dependent receptor [Pseudomonadota bacterium]